MSWRKTGGQSCVVRARLQGANYGDRRHLASRLHDARCLCLRRPAPYQRVDRRIGPEGVLPSVVIDWSCLLALRIGANRRRTDWRALSPAFAQEGNLFTIQTPTRRKRALNVWGFNGCGAPGNKHGGKNTGELHPDQIKGAVDRNDRIANRWRACRACNRRRCGSRAPH